MSLKLVNSGSSWWTAITLSSCSPWSSIFITPMGCTTQEKLKTLREHLWSKKTRCATQRAVRHLPSALCGLIDSIQFVKPVQAAAPVQRLSLEQAANARLAETQPHTFYSAFTLATVDPLIHSHKRQLTLTRRNVIGATISCISTRTSMGSSSSQSVCGANP